LLGAKNNEASSNWGNGPIHKYIENKSCYKMYYYKKIKKIKIENQKKNQNRNPTEIF